MDIKKFLIVLLPLFYFSCTVQQRDDINSIDRESIGVMDSLFSLQLSVLVKVTSQHDTVPFTSWSIEDSVFALNRVAELDFDKNKSRFLEAWGISEEEYYMLRSSSGELLKHQVCGAFKLGHPEVFAFLFRCDESGFDLKERFIIQKKNCGSCDVNNYYTTILDENTQFILGY